MGATKKSQNFLEVVYSKAANEVTRRNSNAAEIATQIKEINNSTDKLKEKTEIIPGTIKSLAEQKEHVEKSREKTVKATDNNMGKGGGSDGNSSGNKKDGKSAKIANSAEVAHKTAAQIKVIEKSGLELDEHGEVVETYLDIWNDEEKLATKIETAEELKRHKQVVKYFEKKGEKVPDKVTQVMDKLVEDFVVSDGVDKKGKNVRRFKTMTEFLVGKKEKDLGFFEKLKVYWGGFWSGKLFFYKGIKKKAEKEILFWDYGKREVKNAEEKIEEAEKHIKKGVEKAKKLNPEVKKAKDLAIFLRSKNGSIKETIRKAALKKYSPSKTRDILIREYQNIGQGLHKFGPEGVKAVQEGRVPGMILANSKGVAIPSLRAGGKIAFFRVTAETIKAAIRNRSWGQFKKTVTSTSWLSNTAEMLPVYGSIASFKRLNDSSYGTSGAFRKFEFGLNIAFDLLTILPFILAEGVSFGAATPLLLGIRAAGGRGIKFLAKYLAKMSPKMMQWLSKKIPKLAEKAISRQESRLAKEGVQKGATELTEEVAESSLEKNAKTMSKKGMKKELKWAIAMEVLLGGVEQSFDEKEVVMNSAVKMVGLNKTQQKVINMAKDA